MALEPFEFKDLNEEPEINPSSKVTTGWFFIIMKLAILFLVGTGLSWFAIHILGDKAYLIPIFMAILVFVAQGVENYVHTAYNNIINQNDKKNDKKDK